MATLGAYCLLAVERWLSTGEKENSTGQVLHPKKQEASSVFALLLESMEDPLAQKGKSSLAISLSFEQFELGDMAFHHSVIDPPSETSSHGIFVFLYPSHKGLEFR